MARVVVALALLFGAANGFGTYTPECDEVRFQSQCENIDQRVAPYGVGAACSDLSAGVCLRKYTCQGCAIAMVPPSCACCIGGEGVVSNPAGVYPPYGYGLPAGVSSVLPACPEDKPLFVF